MKESAYSWWRQLAARERRLISWGSAGLLAALCYAYLWQPIAAERHKLRAALPQLRASAAQMQNQAVEVTRIKASSTPAQKSRDMLSAIRQAASEQTVDGKLLQVRRLDAGRANIALASISLDAWIVLLGNLQKNHGIRLESCTIEALPERGKVSVRAVVTTGA